MAGVLVDDVVPTVLCRTSTAWEDTLTLNTYTRQSDTYRRLSLEMISNSIMTYDDMVKLRMEANADDAISWHGWISLWLSRTMMRAKRKATNPKIDQAEPPSSIRFFPFIFLSWSENHMHFLATMPCPTSVETKRGRS
jgi:hypothetical protein